ncbi:MAG: NAD-dependent epimerase/dehydratase family protein [Candidatus Riflebacteria bacterium]|nr:NAD-dependent epimerase/dehydratase family protein [Candidatus Riflebacteria bacterium]
MNVLITGATGFIGSHLVKVFSKHHRVTVFIRPSSDLRFISRYSPRVVRGEFSDSRALSEALSGQDVVVHTAAMASDWGDYRDFYRVNVEGSLSVIETLPKGTRMIHVSTNAVLGEEDCPTPKPVDAPRRPRLMYPLESIFPSAMNYYRISKCIAEQLIIKRAEQRDIGLTVVRPVWVYGPREFHAGPYEYCQTVLSGVPVMPGCADNKFQTVYVEDLAKIILRISENQSSKVMIYNVGNPEIPTMQDYWGSWCRALGKAAPRDIPKWLLMPLAFFLEALWTLFGFKTPPLFTRARVEMFYASNVYEVKALIEALAPLPFTSLDRGIRKTIRWWRLYKFLKM